MRITFADKKEKDRGRLPTVPAGGSSPRHSPSSPSRRRFNQSPSHGQATSAATFSLPSQTLTASSHGATAAGEGRHHSPRSPRHSTASSRQTAPPPPTTVMAVASVATATSADPPDYASCCCYPAVRFALSSSADPEDGRRRKVNRETVATSAAADNDGTATGKCDGNGDHPNHHHHQEQPQQQQPGRLTQQNAATGENHFTLSLVLIRVKLYDVPRG